MRKASLSRLKAARSLGRRPQGPSGTTARAERGAGGREGGGRDPRPRGEGSLLALCLKSASAGRPRASRAARWVSQLLRAPRRCRQARLSQGQWKRFSGVPKGRCRALAGGKARAKASARPGAPAEPRGQGRGPAAGAGGLCARGPARSGSPALWPEAGTRPGNGLGPLLSQTRRPAPRGPCPRLGRRASPREPCAREARTAGREALGARGRRSGH